MNRHGRQTPATKRKRAQALLNGDAVKKSASPSAADIFAERIASAWQKAVASILEAGRLLIEAKAQLEHGQFDSMIKRKLPFSRRTAEMLMQIAEHPILSNAKYVSLLPPCWGTLVELSRLTVRELEELIADDRIHPNLLLREAKALRSGRLDQEQLRRRYLSQLPEALEALVGFMREHEDPHELVREMRHSAVGPRSHVLDYGEFLVAVGKLPPWLMELRNALEQRNQHRRAEMDEFCARVKSGQQTENEAHAEA